MTNILFVWGSSLMIKKLFDEIGPLLAGFQIAGSIIGFFGIGAIAKWILEHWLPFTRWVWDEFFSFVNLPEISVQEKDALTTLAFFAPMAISSFISWYTRNSPERKGPWGNAPAEDASKEIRLRIYAALVGTTFMVVVGGSVIQDAVVLFTTEAEPALEETAETPLLDIELFARLGLLVAVLGLILALSAALYWLSRRNKKLKSMTDDWFQWLSSNAKPIRYFVSQAAAGFAGTVVSSMASLISFATSFGGIALAAGQLGFIRTASPMLVLVSLLATVFLDPARLLRTAGVVIALIVASLGWDLAVFVVRAVESAPNG